LCADIHLEVNEFSFLVAELEWSYVRLARNQYRPGWTLVALKRHASTVMDPLPAAFRCARVGTFMVSPTISTENLTRRFGDLVAVEDVQHSQGRLQEDRLLGRVQ